MVAKSKNISEIGPRQDTAGKFDVRDGTKIMLIVCLH